MTNLTDYNSVGHYYVIARPGHFQNEKDNTGYDRTLSRMFLMRG